MPQPPANQPTPAKRTRAKQPPATQPAVTDPSVIVAARDLFWENVVREMLTGLSMMQGAHPDMFDGRIAVLTNAGERIPIGEVAPMFACSILKVESWERAAAIAVECTVFRIKTPAGELYTLPVREIRGMHAMTPELLKQIEQQAIQRMADDPNKPPFGLAAFTTVHREQMTEVESPPDAAGGSSDGRAGPATPVKAPGAPAKAPPQPNTPPPGENPRP